MATQEDSGLESWVAPEEGPLQKEADDGGPHSVHQKKLEELRELLLWRLEGKRVSEVKLSQSKCQASAEVEHRAAERIWTYSHGKLVPRQRLEKVRNRGKGKSDEIRQIYSALADHLQTFEKAQDCYLLPIENGILFSQNEIITDDIPEIKVEPRRGVFLAATVSQDRRNVTYRRGQLEDGARGHFMFLTKIGEGCEGTIYKAFDVRELNQFAVKKMEIREKMLLHESQNPFSAFLKLSGCEQTCRAYGVIMDEADNCVYFLMELLEGRTLCDLLEDKDLHIDIPLAVDYAIDILKGLQYIHSKGLIHSDIIGVNIMIVGPRAIIIDTTGARNASSPKSLGYVRDVANAIKLLNNMLWNSTVFSPPPWEASAEDRQKFNKKTLKKLEHLLRRQADALAYNSPMIDTIETLLQDLGEISQELKGLRSPSGSSGSSEDEASSPSKEEYQVLMAKLEASEAKAKRETEMRKKAEQDNKELNDKLDALKAKFEERELDLTADKNEDSTAEE